MGVSYGSLTYFGDLLRCPHKRIVTIMKVYIARNKILCGNNTIPYKLASLVTFESLRWKYSFATTWSFLPVMSHHWFIAPVVPEDSNFDLSTALFHVTMYRQFARKVGKSANSAQIRYYLPRLTLSNPHVFKQNWPQEPPFFKDSILSYPGMRNS